MTDERLTELLAKARRGVRMEIPAGSDLLEVLNEVQRLRLALIKIRTIKERVPWDHPQNAVTECIRLTKEAL